MKILFLNPVGEIGGAERALLTAVAELKRADPAASVHLIAGSPGPLLKGARAAGATVELVPAPSGIKAAGDSGGGRIGKLMRLARAAPASVGYARALRRAVIAAAPDVVHTNGIKCHLLSRAAVPHGVPVVWWVQDFLGRRPLAGKLLRLAAGRCACALVISDAVATDTARVLPRTPIRVVRHATDLAHFSPGPPSVDLDALAGLPPAPPDTVRAGLVATYARWKGHLAVLDAAAIQLKQRPNLPLRWCIVGGPIYHTAAQFTVPELRAAADARGLSGRVGFVPFQPDTADVYRSLDVVIHASTAPEPFGLVIAEGMACGRAVVVSNAGGAAELFADGDDALGVSPGDADGIARAVIRLADDANLRARLGTAARRTAERDFDARRIGPELLALYRALAAAPATAGGIP